MKGTPNRKAKRKVSLVKVSMCAGIPDGMTGEEMDANPALKWFNEGNGKLYFDEANAVLGSADPRG